MTNKNPLYPTSTHFNIKQRLGLLNAYVQAWLKYPGVNQINAAASIVEEARRTQIDHVLKSEGVVFSETDDHFHDAQQNCQKIFRWLGRKDQGSKRSPARLFFVEQAIVGAMPMELRVAYLNEVYGGAAVCFSLEMTNIDTPTDQAQATTNMIREGAEAQIALLALGENPTPAQVRKARAELKESIATSKGALVLLNKRYPEPFTQPKPTAVTTQDPVTKH